MSEQQHNRDILPNGDPDRRRDGALYMEAMERKRNKNRLAARIKRTRKKQRLEALEQREGELSERRQQLEAELRLSRLANRSRICGDDSDDFIGVESRNEALQALCDEVRAVCVQAQSAIDTLTDMQRELSALFSGLGQ
ncbi:hypothetical protein GGI20_001604 [Coemansia sp. BCRC 34301]|nr:hypothetical protein GGI20_001604 [Coemansia sp. BCRC 34301]